MRKTSKTISRWRRSAYARKLVQDLSPCYTICFFLSRGEPKDSCLSKEYDILFDVSSFKKIRFSSRLMPLLTFVISSKMSRYNSHSPSPLFFFSFLFSFLFSIFFLFHFCPLSPSLIYLRIFPYLSFFLFPPSFLFTLPLPSFPQSLPLPTLLIRLSSSITPSSSLFSLLPTIIISPFPLLIPLSFSFSSLIFLKTVFYHFHFLFASFHYHELLRLITSFFLGVYARTYWKQLNTNCLFETYIFIFFAATNPDFAMANASELENDAVNFAKLAVQHDQLSKRDVAVFYYTVSTTLWHKAFTDN